MKQDANRQLMSKGKRAEKYDIRKHTSLETHIFHHEARLTRGRENGGDVEETDRTGRENDVPVEAMSVS
jgi:hypothetical protein